MLDLQKKCDDHLHIGQDQDSNIVQPTAWGEFGVGYGGEVLREDAISPNSVRLYITIEALADRCTGKL